MSAACSRCRVWGLVGGSGPLLEPNDRKVRSKRLTMVRIYDELQGLGYSGDYDVVRRYAAAWRRERSVASYYRCGFALIAKAAPTKSVRG